MSYSAYGDDSRLVEGCINRDLSCWTALVEKYAGLIHIAIKNRLKKYGFTLNDQDIEDIKQGFLTALWRDGKLEGVANRRNIAVWLAISAGNAGLAYVRRMRIKEPPFKVSIFERIGQGELQDLIESGYPSPSEELSSNELSERIDCALEALPAGERLVIKLNLIHNKKYEEIAGILKMPIGTVSSHVKRAREKLKEYLKNLQ
ncbi:MAG: sigma-70 family RNA polymerase sigma factor [Candidatus Omnitrophota bacterium]|jgi:RNA polymerase sigma-70 factor (ECF subfamily)